VASELKAQAIAGPSVDGLGATQQEALHQLDPQISQGHKLCLCFNAFGNHLAADRLGELNQSDGQGSMVSARVDLLDQAAIEFDDVGFELKNVPEAGIACSRIVDGEADPFLAQGFQGLRDHPVILHAGVLRDFQHKALQWISTQAVCKAWFKHSERRDIQGKICVVRQRSQMPQRILTQGVFEFCQQPHLIRSSRILKIG